MITELREVMMKTPEVREPEPLLSIQDLHVWYELRQYGFGHAGYVRAVDGVSFELEEGETVVPLGGYAVVQRGPRQWLGQFNAWGSPRSAAQIMQKLKSIWDPANILNPGEFPALILKESQL